MYIVGCKVQTFIKKHNARVGRATNLELRYKDSNHVISQMRYGFKSDFFNIRIMKIL